MGKNDSGSEEDFELDSEGDDFVSPPPSLKSKSPASSKRKKNDESDDDDLDDFEVVKKSKPTKKEATTKASKKTTPAEKKSSKEPEKKEEKPKETMNQATAEAEVAKYMRQTNRPYSVINVFDNLHRRIGKTMLTKILDVLVEKGELKSKVYGKSVIYYYNQEKLPPPCSATLAKTEESIATVTEVVQELEQQLKEREGVIHGLTNQISDAELSQQLIDYTKEMETLTATLSRLDDPNRPPVDPQKKASITATFTKYRSGWVKRKRIVMDAIDQIAEGMEKKRKDVLDMCGIDTDESVGVKEIPSL
ncbi:pairing protein 2 family protein [Thraustotheca clavata]|uniref:Homologous-pairing protein 2 homolog n=1 Tax=Thraustotheca clavata TaxID=74557 RepID=A0A1V9YSU8_9STRA|nr:pairing protein 2 family protein [Thraustotheca clavata]